MEEAIRQAADPMINYAFGGLCLLLMAAVGCGVKAWRSDTKDASVRYAELSTAATAAIEKNAAANMRLSESLDQLRDHQDELNKRLLTRPCLRNGQ